MGGIVDPGRQRAKSRERDPGLVEQHELAAQVALEAREEEVLGAGLLAGVHQLDEAVDVGQRGVLHAGEIGDMRLPSHDPGAGLAMGLEPEPGDAGFVRGVGEELAHLDGRHRS